MYFDFSPRGRLVVARSSLPLRAAVAGVALSLAACQPSRSVLLPDQAPYVAAALRSQAPGEAVVEIAILPVARSQGIPDAAIGPMREAAYRELVRKGYSALSNQFVDERLMGVDLGVASGDSSQDPLQTVPMDLLYARVHADSILSLRALRLDIEEGGRRRISVRATLVSGASGDVLYEHTRLKLVRDADLTVGDFVELVRDVVTPLPSR